MRFVSAVALSLSRCTARSDFDAQVKYFCSLPAGPESAR
jgi:hypothetical protein